MSEATGVFCITAGVSHTQQLRFITGSRAPGRGNEMWTGSIKVVAVGRETVAYFFFFEQAICGLAIFFFFFFDAQEQHGDASFSISSIQLHGPEGGSVFQNARSRGLAGSEDEGRQQRVGRLTFDLGMSGFKLGFSGRRRGGQESNEHNF